MDNGKLGLYGPEDSKYLRLVARRAKEKGIKTAWVDGPTPGCVAYVADTGAGWPMWDMTREEDVDCIQHAGISCCAAGVLWYIYSLPRDRRVCIIGRGHAVQWSCSAMRCYNREVDQCSSTALDMAYRVARADIIVNSADAATEEVLGAVPTQSTVIDISGSMEPLRDRVADYVPRDYVGRWNIEELLRRVRVRIEEERDG
nr:MAG TPA: Bifunctional protein FolD [Caudoviricetes sp.]